MALVDLTTKQKGIVLSLFANQCYQDPESLFDPKPGITDLSPLKKFFNKPLPPTYINVSGAQAYVMSDKDDVLIACRGTEPTEISDIKADLNTFKISHPAGGKVHKGFWIEYTKIIQDVKTALKKHNPKGTKTVWVCGHSLGGAMALLVSVEIRPNGGCYTFGQPRVGNTEFLKTIDFPYFRYRNNNDIVPTVPPSWLFFKHAGKLRYINHYGNIRNLTPWQKFKDQLRGRWAAIKKFQLFDGVKDHSMNYYYTYISNMDDTGEQIK